MVKDDLKMSEDKGPSNDSFATAGAEIVKVRSKGISKLVQPGGAETIRLNSLPHVS